MPERSMIIIGGGLPPAASDGRMLLQLLCKQEGQPFRSETPAA